MTGCLPHPEASKSICQKVILQVNLEILLKCRVDSLGRVMLRFCISELASGEAHVMLMQLVQIPSVRTTVSELGHTSILVANIPNQKF